MGATHKAGLIFSLNNKFPTFAVDFAKTTLRLKLAQQPKPKIGGVRAPSGGIAELQEKVSVNILKSLFNFFFIFFY